MKFDTYWQYGNDDADNYLKLMYSVDYQEKAIQQLQPGQRFQLGQNRLLQQPGHHQAMLIYPQFQELQFILHLNIILQQQQEFGE